MQISVSFRNVDPSDHLKSYAENRMTRFKKYMEEPVEIHLVLSIQKFRHMADVTISANGFKIKAQEETGDLYSAIDMVLDKIEKQIKRHREKVKEHKPEIKTKGRPATKTKTEEIEIEEDEPPQIVKTETMVAKPMDAEEAALQLRLSSSEFLVFTNSKTRLINVLYRRKDGHFGLIEPVS
ncbi:MAG: ribosome-associated translation inhibitor RaiA [Thermodesulfobacteriota bacterium]